MMNLKTLLSKFLFLLVLVSCAQIKKSKKYDDVGFSRKTSHSYNYFDVTGEYVVTRESFLKNKKLYTRRILNTTTGSDETPLEKTITVSNVGVVSIKGKRYPILKPFASQHEVWLEGKRYFVQGKVNSEKRSLELTMESPDEQWNGRKEVKFPKGYTFCFFTQLPECLHRTGFLQRAAKLKKGTMPLYVIWDIYPYHLDQYDKLKDELFSSARLSFAEKMKTGYKFALDMEKHTLFFHFDLRMNFSKMFWIAQGIRMEKR